MYIRFSALLPVAALAAVVSASPNALEARWGSSECDTGSITCCQNTVEAYQSSYYEILQLLGLITSPTELVGENCVAGFTSCPEQPVCCNNNNFNGVVVVGCSPISLK